MLMLCPPNPNEFDITRENIKHVSFGYGPHMCIGAHLARIETKLAFETLFDRFELSILSSLHT